MAPTKKNPTPAEVGLAQLKNCLVNLPSALVTVLVNANTVRASGSFVGLR